MAEIEMTEDQILAARRENDRNGSRAFDVDLTIKEPETYRGLAIKIVRNVTRVCDQTGMSEKLRKE